jgi:hypothetical protein
MTTVCANLGLDKPVIGRMSAKEGNLMFDLAVAYRIYPGISKIPPFHSTDKYKLSEMCLRSFKGALGNIKVKVFAILDGCPPEYESLFRGVFKDDALEIVALNKEGNHKTFSRQIDILTAQTEAEYVYFAEDDYFYFPDAMVKMVDFMRKHPDADFVTPYDHPDSYYTSSRFERHLVKPHGDRYWRTASSTCLTFLTSRATLIRTASTLRTFSSGNLDCPVWLALTQKFGLVDPRVHMQDRFRLKILALTWIWGFRRILFGRPYRLWAPLPTLSTHMESAFLAPLIDWQDTFRRAEEQRCVQ